MAESARAWQRMLSGRRLDLLNPSPFDVEIEDIARGLSRVARWNGQTSGDWAYSVAAHSLLVEQLCRQLKPKLAVEAALIALLHDAPEYVIGDLISPFKAVVGGDYKALERRLFEACLLRFGLSGRDTDATMGLIKRADRASAYLEAVQVAGFSEDEARKIFRPPQGLVMDAFEVEITPPSEIEQAFLRRFYTLLNAYAPR